jgi:hypothetical protein
MTAVIHLTMIVTDSIRFLKYITNILKKFNIDEFKNNIVKH